MGSKEKNIIVINRILTAIGYIAYPALLVAIIICEPGNYALLASRIAVPAAAFIVVTAARAIINAPRPYEGDGAKPALIDKKTRGKSFPSRHAFCMFMVAFAWMSWVPTGIPLGCALTVCAVVLAITRVKLGVHYPRDVIAGALCALAFSLIGYLLVPHFW